MTKAERTRAFIIEQTAPIFNKKGYAGTSINDITEATGLTKGSIYGNFANKDEVALAVFDFNFRRITDVLGAEMAKHASAIDKLMVYMKVYGDFVNYPFLDSGCPIQNTTAEADDTHPRLRQKANDALISWKKSLEKLIDQAVKEGDFKPVKDKEQVALTMMALIEGGIMIGKATGKASYRKAIMRSVEQLLNSLK